MSFSRLLNDVPLLRPAILLACGAAGGITAAALGAPMPYMVGSLLITALLALVPNPLLRDAYRFPELFRRPFVGLIGVMIGSTFTPDLLNTLGTLWISLSAVVVFVLFNHWSNYLICRRLGGFDKPTAFYAGTPGGFVESIELGTAAGGDTKTITLQHFARIILVVTLVPLLLYFWTGQTVGSASGISFGAGAKFDIFDMGIIALLGIFGYVAGKVARLPAYFLVGPLIASALAHALGWTDARAPTYLSAVAQVVLGTSLGARFSGLELRDVRVAFKVGAASVSLMLLTCLAFSAVLVPLVGESVEVLFIALAPGGVIEMGLIALSLNANPVFVTAHHVFRISVTVITMVFSKRLILGDQPAGGKR